jgi:hypothetical protein
MGYSILAIRSAAEDDGRLYPVVGDSCTPVRPEQWDGETQRVTASALQVSELVSGGLKTVARFPNIKAEILITDSRVVVASSKYEKGGGWIGFGAGAFVAVAANGVSKALAAQRRRGKMLVGQARYPWLRCVGAKPKAGWGSSEQLRIGVVVKSENGGTRELLLDATLPKDVDSSAVARGIITRAARYRLEYTAVEDDERARYEELADAQRLSAPAPKSFAMYQLPRYYFVSTECAYPESDGSATQELAA